MAEDLNQITELILKYYYDEGELTRSEQDFLDRWIDSSPNNRLSFERFADPDYTKQQLQRLKNSDKETAWAKILEAISEPHVAGTPPSIPVIRRAVWKRYMVAAVLAGALAAGIWAWSVYRPVNKAETPITSRFGSDVLPGGNKAILTLADGTTIAVADVSKGTIARQGNTAIEKTDSGRLAYSTSAGATTETSYNTLTTPPAGQFQLVLPDGTKVFLNNASSLRYPTSFTGSSREVELHGEAYFEVARDIARPFTVKADDHLTVNVLGTNFNVMAYEDEASLKTTLLTGGVRVTQGSESVVLKPGEQARASALGAGAMDVEKDVDAEGVIAWKNGLFHFERADIRTVMRVLARWYDVNVVYEGPVTDHLFGGDIQRNLNLSQVLDILEHNQVHFTINGKKITVRH